MTTIPILTTSHLVLRPFSKTDAAELFPMWVEPDTIRYFPFKSPLTLERTERIVEGQADHWERYDYGWWAVTLPGTGEFVGWCGLQYLPDTNEVEVAYMLAKKLWGQGLGSEAAAACVKFGFERLPVEEIVGIVHRQNVPSQRVLEKVGGTSRTEERYFDMDCFRYAINRESFVSATGLALAE